MTEHNRTEARTEQKKHVFLWDEISEADFVPPEHEATPEELDALQALEQDRQQALFERLMQAELATL